jgi:hypothetical protein
VDTLQRCPVEVVLVLVLVLGWVRVVGVGVHRLER